MIELLRLSAAIPFALPSGGSPTGDWVVDGGVVDNLPLLPVIQRGVKTIVILCLDPDGARKLRDPARLQRKINDDLLAYRLEQLSAEKAKAVYEEFGRDGLDRWYSGCALTGIRFVVLGPGKPLPTLNVPFLRFLTGTLNQSVETRRKWMKQGYDETVAFLGPIK